MSLATLYRVAGLVGLIMAALCASSAVAWKFGWAAELGQPLFWHFYHPVAVVTWGRAWGLTPDYETDFVGGLTLAMLVMVAPLLAVRLVDLYGPLRVADRDPDQGFGTVKQLLKTRRFSRQHSGVVVGHDGQGLIRDHSDRHVLVVAPTRTGKGTVHVIPTLLSYPCSMVVHDPKFELAAITGRQRRAFGPTFAFNPVAGGGVQFNPLLELRGGPHLIGECQSVALMLAQAAQASSADKFWEIKFREVVTALLIHVCSSPAPTLRHLYRAAQQWASGIYPVSSHPHVQAEVAAFVTLEDRVQSSINATISGYLEWLADPMIQASTACSDFRASDLQASDRPVTVFLSVPVADAERLMPLTRLLLQSLLGPLTTSVRATSDGRRKRQRVCFVLDEFPHLGRIHAIEKRLPVCAGFGIRMMLVCQDENQIREIYGQNQSITANAGTICSVAGFSGLSLDTVARWGGKVAVAHAAKQRPNSWRGGGSHSQSEAEIPLLDPADMIERGADEVLVFTGGCRPTWLKKRPYYSLSEFRGLYDAEAPTPTGEGYLAWLRR